MIRFAANQSGGRSKLAPMDVYEIVVGKFSVGADLPVWGTGIECPPPIYRLLWSPWQKERASR